MARTVKRQGLQTVYIFKGKEMKKSLVAIGVTVCAALSACSATSDKAESPSATINALADVPSLSESIEALRVGEERPQGYKRSMFPHWIDQDGDGCDTRAEVLFSEAIEPPTVDRECRISGGMWLSVYDQVRVTNAGDLDIDHVVGLAEVWQSGADTWVPEQRKAFANDLSDPRSLVAVTASVNRAKGADDPAEWLPPVENARCSYISDWVTVKTRWNLAVDQKEKDVLLQWVNTCQ